MDIPIPRFILRKIIRRNPWLLSDSGAVKRPIQVPVPILPFLVTITFEVVAIMTLTSENKAIFQAEADAGTLFPET